MKIRPQKYKISHQKNYQTSKLNLNFLIKPKKNLVETENYLQLKVSSIICIAIGKQEKRLFGAKRDLFFVSWLVRSTNRRYIWQQKRDLLESTLRTVSLLPK